MGNSYRGGLRTISAAVLVPRYEPKISVFCPSPPPVSRTLAWLPAGCPALLLATAAASAEHSSNSSAPLRQKFGVELIL